MIIATATKALPTEEEWKQLETAMQSPFGEIKFEIDGYIATFQRKFLSANKITTMVYVDGYFKGGWMFCEKDKPKHEEARRFLQLKSKALYSSKQKENALKTLGKKLYTQMGYESKFYYCDPYWKSFRSLKAHLLKNNKNIRVLNKDH